MSNVITTAANKEAPEIAAITLSHAPTPIGNPKEIFLLTLHASSLAE